MATETVDLLIEQALLNARARKDEARVARKGDGPRTSLYASEVGTVDGESACHRKLWYDLHGAPKDPMPADTLLNFEIGDIIGLRVANLLAADGQVEKVELPLSFGEFPVSGRLDVLLRGHRIVEVKSATLKQKKYLPKVEHIGQLNLYLHALDQIPEHAGQVEAGDLIYIFKDPTKGQPVHLSFPVPYDLTAASELLVKFQKAWMVARGDTLPERSDKFTPKGYPCGYCSFQTHCWSRVDGGVPF